MTLCDLCDHHKPASAFFCMTHWLCRLCPHDFEEEIQEYPSCVKRTLFRDFSEPAPSLMLPEPEYVDLVSLTLKHVLQMDVTITRTLVPADQLQEGAARRLGPKVDYNCHECFTRYTWMPLATGQIICCSNSTSLLISECQRVLSQNLECTAGFCTPSSTCIWRIKPVGQASRMPESVPVPLHTPEPMEPATPKSRKSAVPIETSPAKLQEK